MQILAKESNIFKGVFIKAKDLRWVVLNLLYGLIAFFSARGSVLDSILPFSVAFFGTMASKDKKNIWIGIPLMFGITVNTRYEYIFFRYLAVILSLSCIVVIFEKKLRKTPLAVSFYTSLICGLATTIYHRISGIILMYDLFLIGAEITLVFVFSYILHRVPYFTESKSKRLVLEDILCMIVILGVFLSSAMNIIFYELRIMLIIAVLATFIIAYGGGISIGALTGALLGLLMAIIGKESQNTVIILMTIGLTVGLFSKHLRIMSSLSAIILLFILSSTYVIQINRMAIEVIIAAMLFSILPSKIIRKIKEKMSDPLNDEVFNNVYDTKLRRVMGLNLKKYSNIFDNLSFIYGGSLEKQQIIDVEEDGTEIIEKVKNGICVDCDFLNKCWNQSNYKTTEVMKEILSKINKSSRIDKSYVNTELNFSCEHMDKVLYSIFNSLQLLGTSFKWQKKLEGGRMVTAAQFKGISRSINNMIKELNRNISFDADMERKILLQCHKRGLDVKNVFVIEKRKDDVEVYIEIENAKMYNEEMEEIVSYIFGGDYIISDEEVDQHIIALVRCPEYKMSVGSSKYAKEMNICGDSYVFENLKSNEYMIALSDGMGAGEKAAHQSMVTINALRHLLRIGFEKELALKTINSMLVLKSTEEIFSTVDIAIIDLDKGNASFYKMGAASAFIKSVDGEIKVIKHGNLPVGIVYQIEIEEMTEKLSAEDILIMVSDGILDAYEGEDKIEWMKGVIASIKSREPQTIADLILNKALDEYKDRERDDMTVITAKMERVRKASGVLYSKAVG
ncbi:MAG: stage II sporulation protein E [Peptostreptococcales bacterium]|jgi:stage II sporulation protein E